MGGHAIYQFSQHDPAYFAAIIASACNPAKWDEQKFEDLPIWGFIGEADQKDRVNGSNNFLKKMKKREGNYKLTTLANMGHGSSHLFMRAGEPEPFKDVNSKGKEKLVTLDTKLASDKCDPETHIFPWLFKHTTTRGKFIDLKSAPHP
jgi:hypothetical protein